ncbi:YraN family protein [Georgenia deserti]|uniref:UPF0102 protein ACFSE6_16195 n=1 Tax=Georgenia deserti TaxID=2093781 RepID=A0ABW4L7K9_9MICO
MQAKDAVGKYGERVVARDLAARGWEVLDRNWRCPHGELDVVAREPATDTVVFVEVKTRRSTAYGHPAEAITRTKLGRLRRLAFAWLAAHDRRAAAVRIDVAAVLVPRSGAARVEYVRAVG